MEFFPNRLSPSQGTATMRQAGLDTLSSRTRILSDTFWWGHNKVLPKMKGGNHYPFGEGGLYREESGVSSLGPFLSKQGQIGVHSAKSCAISQLEKSGHRDSLPSLLNRNELTTLMALHWNSDIERKRHDIVNCLNRMKKASLPFEMLPIQ